MKLIAELKMPQVGSWNGRWSGESEKYTISLGNVKEDRAKELVGDYYYNFGDGWGASVEIREQKHREKVTNKFCGYNWMVDSIKRHGKIKSESITPH